MSASSASTRTWFTFPLYLSPTVNLTAQFHCRSRLARSHHRSRERFNKALFSSANGMVRPTCSARSRVLDAKSRARPRPPNGIALWLKGASSGGPPWPHLAGLVLLGGAALAAGGLSALSLGVMASAILVLVAVWEQILRSPAADLPASDG